MPRWRPRLVGCRAASAADFPADRTSTSETETVLEAGRGKRPRPTSCRVLFFWCWCLKKPFEKERFESEVEAVAAAQNCSALLEDAAALQHEKWHVMCIQKQSPSKWSASILPHHTCSYTNTPLAAAPDSMSTTVKYQGATKIEPFSTSVSPSQAFGAWKFRCHANSYVMLIEHVH